MSLSLEAHARTMTYRPETRLELFKQLTVAEQSAVFELLSPYVQQSVLKQLSLDDVVDLLDHMDMQHAQQALLLIPSAKRREKIVSRLKGDVKEKMDYFLRFHPDATLALINFNYLFLSSALSIGEAAELVSEHYEETGKYPEILVHEKGTLVGQMPLAAMVRERNSSLLKKHYQPVETITYHSSVNEIIDRLVSTNNKKVVILDQDSSVLGIVYAESIRPLFSDLPAESLYEFTGVDDSERPFDSVMKKVSNRYRWLVFNLATCFLAGSVILVFQDTLNALTILTVYIPIVAGMGGNSASQAFAITMRGLTLGTISYKTAWPALRREMLAGAINGLIVGSIVALVSSVWNGETIIGLIVGLVLVAIHTIAPLAGASIPLIMKRLGKDPAATSSIFITTITDVVGLILLLGVSTLILL